MTEIEIRLEACRLAVQMGSNAATFAERVGEVMTLVEMFEDRIADGVALSAPRPEDAEVSYPRLVDITREPNF